MAKIVRVKLLQEFKELFNPDWRNLVYYGGRGSGKSMHVAEVLLIRGSQSKLRILCTREIQKTIKDSVHKLLADLISEHGYTDYEVTDKAIRNKRTGTEFIFSGLKHNVNEIKSMEGVDIAWCEEAQSLSEQSLKVLAPTIRKEGSQLIFTFNRVNELDPVYVRYVMNKPEKTFVAKVNYDVLNKAGLFPESLRLELEEDRKYPELFNHVWLGEPISQSEMSILNRDTVLKAMERSGEDDGAIEVGADIARLGNDRIVFWKRKGLKTIDHKILSKLRTTETCDALEQFVDFDKTILIKVDDTGVGCITEDTAILTPDGWKYPKELHAGDTVYSKDEQGFVTETTIFNINERESDIIEAGGYKFAWAHQLPFKTRNNYEYKLGTWEQATNYKQAIFDTKFNYEVDEQDFYLPQQSITMPNGGEKIINEDNYVDAEEFALLLGWYASEGSLDRSSKCITITQKKTQHFDEIVRVMSYFGKVQIKANGKSGGKDFKVFNTGLMSWIESNCYKGGFGFKYKTVPRFIANNSQRVIKSFLTAFRDGDGYIHSNGRNYYVTSSVNLVDDILELIYKTGKAGGSYKKYDKGTTFQIEGRTATRTEDNYVVFEYSRNGYGIANKPTKTYKGKVHSIILNNDTRMMFTKVDGKCPFWTHNGGVTDEMMKRGYNIMAINFGEAAVDKDKYPNWISEAWFYMQTIMEEADLPMSNELLMELSTRQWFQDTKGKRRVESKGEYKKRGFRSPDLADACIICYYTPIIPKMEWAMPE